MFVYFSIQVNLSKAMSLLGSFTEVEKLKQKRLYNKESKPLSKSLTVIPVDKNEYGQWFSSRLHTQGYVRILLLPCEFQESHEPHEPLSLTSILCSSQGNDNGSYLLRTSWVRSQLLLFMTTGVTSNQKETDHNPRLDLVFPSLSFSPSDSLHYSISTFGTCCDCHLTEVFSKVPFLLILLIHFLLGDFLKRKCS